MIAVYGLPNCVWCTRAKDLLSARGVPFAYVNLMEDDAAYQEILIDAGRKTVPQIFDGDDYIGGYEGLAAHLTSVFDQ